jgi:hypothetical protein
MVFDHNAEAKDSIAEQASAGDHVDSREISSILRQVSRALQMHGERSSSQLNLGKYSHIQLVAGKNLAKGWARCRNLPGPQEVGNLYKPVGCTAHWLAYEVWKILWF